MFLKDFCHIVKLLQLLKVDGQYWKKLCGKMSVLNEKMLPENFLPLPRNRIKILSTSYGFCQSYAAFTLNGFDDQERNRMFAETDFQVLKLKFHACNKKQALYPLPTYFYTSFPVSTWMTNLLLSSLLSYSVGPFSSSFSAESLALINGLKWCHSHLKTCHFQSTLLLTDSHSALALLSTASGFLQPKSF